MRRELRRAIVISNGRKFEIPDPTKVILAVRDCQGVHHQASVDVTVPNITNLKRTIRRAVL